jgi:hypothetical protein
MLFRLKQPSQYDKFAFLATTAIILMLVGMALPKYPGQMSVYILFTVISNVLLYLGISKNAIFFDAFVGIFFWLGFWLKLTLRLVLSEGVFNDSVGNFDRSGVAFDRALLVATCGLSGLLFVSLIRRKFFFNYPNQIQGLDHKFLFDIYKRYKKIILTFFVLIFLSVAISNVFLVIYQKGRITQTILPFGLNGVYKWLLLFGLASFSALILRFEFEINKKTSFMTVLLSLLENFVSNVSMLSRGMILNAGGLLYGVLVALKLNVIKSRLSFFVSSFLVLCILFVSSVLLVNYFRANLYDDTFSKTSHKMAAMTAPLFIDRWVGMEGVMSVSSYPNLGWDLWKAALKETYNENETSFYDNNIIESPYINTNKIKHHFISLPGIVAFFFYPGSFCFLFASMFALGGFAAMIEFSTYKLGGKNVILCALIAQVVAYRFACFGYVPAQSYMLLGAIFLTLFIIHFTEKLVGFYNNK